MGWTMSSRFGRKFSLYGALKGILNGLTCSQENLSCFIGDK
jgi:hypothetical protein